MSLIHWCPAILPPPNLWCEYIVRIFGTEFFNNSFLSLSNGIQCLQQLTTAFISEWWNYGMTLILLSLFCYNFQVLYNGYVLFLKADIFEQFEALSIQS